MLTRTHLTGSALGALCLLSITSLACAEGEKATASGKTTATQAGSAATTAGAATSTKEGTAPTTGKLAAAQGAKSTAALAATAGADELVVLETSSGEVVIDLFEDKTPGHAENMKKLVRQGYYDGSPFHRVIDGFMAQGGGKTGADGQPVDVGYTIPAEIVPGLNHHRGSVAAARTSDAVNPERKSSGSQFYICFADATSLDGAYTVFGEVVSGMENVDKLAKGDRRANGVLPAGTASTIVRAWLKPKDATTAGKTP